MLIHSVVYAQLCMVFSRSKGIIALWINSHYLLVSAPWKIKFRNSLAIMLFGKKRGKFGKIQKQN